MTNALQAKSLTLTIPDDPPFNKPENWFETFVGRELLPAIESCSLENFWFLRYGAIGSQPCKSIKLRFATIEPGIAARHFDALVRKYGAGEAIVDYDVAGDIGTGQGSRFYGMNSRHADTATRGWLAFDFLSAAARLFVHCLSGPNPEGCYSLEPETTSGFSFETSMEQFHHLFCNMTGVPTYIGVLRHVSGQVGFDGAMYASQRVKDDPSWTIDAFQRVSF